MRVRRGEKSEIPIWINKQRKKLKLPVYTENSQYSQTMTHECKPVGIWKSGQHTYNLFVNGFYGTTHTPSKTSMHLELSKRSHETLHSITEYSDGCIHAGFLS